MTTIVKNLAALAFTASSTLLSAGDFVAPEVTENRFYLGISGGAAGSSLSSPDFSSKGVGGSFAGRAHSLDIHFDEIYGVYAGYQATEKLRLEVGYYKTGADLDWTADFGMGDITNFEAELDADIFLVSAYYTFAEDQNFTPYLGLSLGVSNNDFHSAKEYFPGFPGVGSFVENNSETQFAFRFTAGTDYAFTDSLSLNIDLSLMNIGDFGSGNSRTLGPLYGGATQSIGSYDLKDTWFTTLSLGAKYHF